METDPLVCDRYDRPSFACKSNPINLFLAHHMIGERKDWRARSRERAAARKNAAAESDQTGIKATRLDDILKTAHPITEEQPPPPPARSESRDIKQILATHRSRPRRPLNERRDNGK
eukprot:sb/3476488/